VTFFFDRQMAFEIVLRLRAVGVSAIHLRDQFPRGAKDVEWIPVVGQNGWILITADHRILSHRLEKEALRDYHVTAFFCPKEFNNKQAHNRLEWLLEHWKAIEQYAAKAGPGEHFMISLRGKITKRTARDAG
jgi:hypothetical protein